MKLTVLVDNNTLIDHYFLGEPGVSYLIEDDITVLFDVGYSDVFVKNAQRLKIDLLDVDFVLLSHGHLDHTGGLEALVRMHSEATIEGIPHKKPVLIAHPHALLPKLMEGMGHIGIMVEQARLEEYFDLHLSTAAVWLTEHLVFLGQISRVHDFEGREPLGKMVGSGGWQDDYVLDDTALVYKGKKGLVVITGCSHAGICNIIEQAKRVCDEQRIVDVIGGLHLLNPSKVQLEETVHYIGGLGLEQLHACHCTDMASKMALATVSPIEEVGVGLTLEYE